MTEPTGSQPPTLSELQEFLAQWWYLYDEAQVAEFGPRLAPDVRFVSRSDSGSSPVEALLAGATHGREETAEWLREHRLVNPYPLRHIMTNLFRTGGGPASTAFRAYGFVTKIAGGLPVNVSTFVSSGQVARGPQGLWITELEVVIDTVASRPAGEALAERTAAGTRAGS